MNDGCCCRGVGLSCVEETRNSLWSACLSACLVCLPFRVSGCILDATRNWCVLGGRVVCLCV